MVRVGVVDSRICNIASVLHALRHLGCTAEAVGDAAALGGFSHLILPGVGSFDRGMRYLRERGLDEAVVRRAETGVPVLGLCLGMQLLAEEGEEFGPSSGLGLIPGRISLLRPPDPTCRVPHVGWNDVTATGGGPLFRGIPQAPFYFVHSYSYEDHCAPCVAALTDHGGPVVAAVAKDHVFGVQFHPEKSQKNGLHLLRNFVTLC